MAIEIRTPTDDDVPALFRRDEESFPGISTPEERELIRQGLDLERFRIAVDGRDLVGIAGSHEKTLTLPGGAVVPMGGTTWVSVAPTHRRRGLLRRLMAEVHDDIRDRGEPSAGLLASEGAIYERFGYGVATRWRIVEIDRRQADVQPRFLPDDLDVRMVDPAEHPETLADIFDRHQRSTVGEVSRARESWARRIERENPGLRCVLHPDGFALWKLTADWGEGEPNHELRLLDFVAVTPDAHAALWHTVLSHDLVGPVRARTAVAVDDPLPYLLTDPRAVRTVALTDMLWVCPFDVPALFGERSYRVDDAFVVDVDGEERWRVASDGVTASDAEPDLSVTRGALGALLLGGVSASELAGGRRITADPDVIRRADLFFGWNPVAHTTTGF